MIVTLYDLEKICNYSENSKPSLPNGIINYLEFIESDTEEYKNLVKSKRRDLTIDAILEDKIDEWTDSETWGIDLDQEGYTRSISPQMKSLTVKSQKFIDNQTLYYDIVKKLESLTNQPMTNHNINNNMNVIIKNNPNLSSYDNDNSNFRKIISKVMMLNSLIGMESRLGPANSMLIGLDVYMYLLKSDSFIIQNNGTTVTGNISGIDIIPSHLINTKKVILMRNSNKPGIGLNVINNVNDSTYYMAETPVVWEKCIKWFEII
jgi:hypothetical protein